MSGVNINVSVTNLPQVDRHQNDIHKNPIINQDQNARIANEEISRRLNMPVEPESTQGKIIDTNQKKEDSQKKGKRKQSEEKKSDANLSKNDEGLIIDIQA